MTKCKICGKESILIAQTLGVCLDCIRGRFEECLPFIQDAHKKSRIKFGLPAEPPRSQSGIKCNICINECEIPEGEYGYCGLRKNEDGKLVHLVNKDEGNLEYYHDPLPTNCVASWICGEKEGYGNKNLAVFYNGCSFNCLYCQNWHYRENIFHQRRITAQDLANQVDNRTKCICYFGGDPTPQIEYSINTAKIVLSKRKVRICWETNGCMNTSYLKQIAELSLESGGCIKFDLKAYHEEINIALCGASNKRTLENFKILAEYDKQRDNPPFLIASTLLVPGYIDVEEVSKISQFIAELNPEIPYSLLAFYPCFYFSDLPTTSKSHAEECKDVALKNGLKNVKIGNLHLLGDAY